MNKQMWSESFGFGCIVKNEEDALWKARFIKEVEKETSRGSVLTIVSFIDELLIKLLESYFPNKKHAEKLLSELDGCMSTIIHRANIAYSLALIRETEFNAIKVLARIRNVFAHQWDGISFESDEISKLVRKFPQEYFKYVDGSNKGRFNRVASSLVQELLGRSVYADHICKHLPNEYKDIFDLSDEERRKVLEREST